MKYTPDSGDGLDPARGLAWLAIVGAVVVAVAWRVMAS